MFKKYCVLFAGPVGSSKTPTAYHLSYTFNIPIFSHDAIRTEVAEDLLNYDQQEYQNRKNERLKKILENGCSFVYDSSIDRSWKELKEILLKYGYEWFIASFDLSREFLSTLCKIKGYNETLGRIDSLLKDHQNFILRYNQEVDISINDQNFSGRLELVVNKLLYWINQD